MVLVVKVAKQCIAWDLQNDICAHRTDRGLDDLGADNTAQAAVAETTAYAADLGNNGRIWWCATS